MNALGLSKVPEAALLIAAGLTLVFVAFSVWWAYDERSARGVQRRAKSSGKSVAAGAGLGLASVVGVLAGFGEGTFAALGSLGNVLSGHAGFAVDLGLAGLGASVVAGHWNPRSVYAYLAVCGIIVVAGVLWRGK